MDSLRSSGTSDRDAEGGRAGTHRIDEGPGEGRVQGNVLIELENGTRGSRCTG